MCKRDNDTNAVRRTDSRSGGLATASIHPRKPWVLLHVMLSGTAKKTPADFDVIAYFGRVRGLDVHGRTGTEKQGKRRQFRRAFRPPTPTNSISETIFIDVRTPPAQIAEQLAAFCLRRNIDPDGSLRRLIGLSSPDETRRQVAARVVQDFRDPTDPRSYPSFLKTVRGRVLVPTLSNNQIDDDETEDPKTSSPESLKWFRPKKSRVVPALGVARTSAEFGIPTRTLYHWIRTGRLCPRIGSHGRLVLNTEDVEKALAMHQAKARSLKRALPDADERSAVIEKVAQAQGIQYSSARKRINRAIAAGKILPELQPPKNDPESQG